MDKDQYEELLLELARAATVLTAKILDNENIFIEQQISAEHFRKKNEFIDSQVLALNKIYERFFDCINQYTIWEEVDLFKDKPDPIDWAEEQARYIVSQSLEIRKSFAQKYEDVPFVLSYALALELRSLKHDFQKASDSSAQHKAKVRTRQLRQELSTPGFLAERCRERATELDTRGYTGEAGALREAATILEEDF